MHGPVDEITAIISVPWMKCGKCGSDSHWCDLEMLGLKIITAKIGVDADAMAIRR
jgi:hypothetical protein